jgi:hypothetical protein
VEFDRQVAIYASLTTSDWCQPTQRYADQILEILPIAPRANLFIATTSGSLINSKWLAIIHIDFGINKILLYTCQNDNLVFSKVHGHL